MERDQRSSGSLLLLGLIGGVIAGVVFLAAQMAISIVMGGAIVDPLRLVGSVVLSVEALSPIYPVAMAASSGLIVLVVLSSIYGAICTFLLAYTRQLSNSTVWLLIYGSLFGAGLWIINFLVIAPIVWSQFILVNQFWNGFVAHTFFYGLVLGAFIATTRSDMVTASTLDGRYRPNNP